MSSIERVSPATIEKLISDIRAASELSDLTEARARVEAARAWAKVHGEVKAMRLDLLRVEVEALVRIVELGGIDTLPARDRKAARALAAMSAEERGSVVESSGTTTTATGMMRGIWQGEELQREREAGRRMGRVLAQHPELVTDDDALRADIRRSIVSVQEVVGQLLDDYVNVGEDFTIGEFADEVIRTASTGLNDVDPDVRAGINHICGEAVRRHPVVKLQDTILPRIITALSDGGNHIRVPIENALVGHLAQMCAMREEQIRQDKAALKELSDVLARLRAMPGAADTSRIGDLLAASIASPGAAA